MTKIFIRISLVSFFFMVWGRLPAQSNDVFVVLGVILDKDTKEPLPYASLAIQNSSFGSIANEHGEFNFAVSKEMIDDTLVFSFVGYARQYKQLSGLTSNIAIEVLLVQQPTLLNEVSVESVRYDANQIMENAVSAIKRNYPSAPFIMEGFFRELIKEDAKYIDLTEAVIRVYDK